MYVTQPVYYGTHRFASSGIDVLCTYVNIYTDPCRHLFRMVVSVERCNLIKCMYVTQPVSYGTHKFASSGIDVLCYLCEHLYRPV